MMGIGKNDYAAQDAWGEKAYADIPKSVFALLAYYFAERLGEGRVIETTLAELDALSAPGNGIIDPAQAKRSAVALKKGPPR